MQHPLGKSISSVERYRRLMEVVDVKDILAVLINADPDAMASALALRRLFWHKTRKIHIYRINRIERADNLAFALLLDSRIISRKYFLSKSLSSKRNREGTLLWHFEQA